MSRKRRRTRHRLPPCPWPARRDGGRKTFGVGNDVVRRGNQHQTIRVRLGQMQHSGQNGGCSIAGSGFDQDGAGFNFGSSKLFGHDKAEIICGYHQRCGIVAALQPFGRRLKQAFLTHQWGKLLGVAFAGQGPQTGSRTAAQKNWSNHDLAFQTNGADNFPGAPDQIRLRSISSIGAALRTFRDQSKANAQLILPNYSSVKSSVMPFSAHHALASFSVLALR